MFQPHILPVQQGSTVDFVNNDSVAHNVFWTSVGGNKKLGHNLGTWPQNEKRSFKFDALGVVPLFCNVHSEMSGYILVVPTPYFALTSSSGEYRIENIPDGIYTLAVWHEGISSRSKTRTLLAIPSPTLLLAARSAPSDQIRQLVVALWTEPLFDCVANLSSINFSAPTISV